ncbi:MAG: PAS domain-containing protein, partial [Gammaproteobacteria bacterium]
ALPISGEGELGVRLAAKGEPAWDAIAEAFNSTMANIERERERLVRRETERQQGDAALLSLREALDSHAIVSVAAANGDIVFVNDEFCRSSGYAADELLGRNHSILKSGAHDAAFYREMRSTIRAGRAWHGVIENRRKDGGHYWVQSSILPVLDAHGVPRQYISIRTDISSRERLRKGLEMLACAEHGQALFASLVHGLSVGLDARWTGLSRLCSDGGTLEVVACWDAGAPGETFRYALAGAPCEHAMATDEAFVVGSDVRAQFPHALALATLNVDSYRGLVVSDHRGRPIGVLWAMSERPADADAGEAALLAVAAKRAAAELSRLGVEGELHDKDKRLETVIEGAGLAVWDWEIPSDRVHVNERWATMLGYAADSPIKRLDDWRRLLHPDDAPHVEAALQRHLDGETPAFSAELRLRACDGQWVWILDSGRVTRRDAAGRPLRATGIHLDITERRRAEQALAAERSRLELALRAGRIGFWDWDLESGAVATNDVVQTVFGTVAAGFRDMREWFSLIHPDDREDFVTAARACLDGRQESFQQIARWRTERGWIWLRSQSQVTARDAEGRALRMMGVHIDIDEQRRAEERIREQEERLRLVVDCAALGIWDWDMSTGRVESNERLAHMLGYEPADLQTHASLAALAHPDDVALLNDATRAHLQGRSPFFAAEVRLRGSHGQWMWVLSRGRIARRDAQGRAVRMAGIHFDVTERHVAALERDRLQAQLQQAQKMEALGQLTGGIAHDFNNILASILGYASLAHGRYAGGNAKLTEYLAAVITAGERARDLIAKMLAFSRDTPRERGSSMDVAALVREVATLLASVIPSSITIAVDVAADVPRVQLGATDLHQVLVNLAVNARDAMGESGRLDITVAAVRCVREVCSTCHELVDGDYVEIVCRDTGSGMDETLLKRVFEPFF